jgi:hypothetical protein
MNAPGRVEATPPYVTGVTDLRTRPGAQERGEKAFYELDRWSKYNDPLLAVGFLTVVASVALMWLPYTLAPAGMLLGLGMMKLAWMMGKGK